MESVKRRNNSLDHAQAARLYAWLEESRIWASTATAQKCAELAVVELKFGITSSNILSAKRALNITKPAPVAPDAGCRCKHLARIIVDLASRNTLTFGPHSLKAIHEIADYKPVPSPAAPDAPGLPGIGEGAAA